MRNALLAASLLLFATPALAEPPIIFRIQDISPHVIRPQGGDLLTITGTGFQSPIRVWIGAREAFVVSVTYHQLVLITPAFDLGEGQTKELPVDVYNQAGTIFEQRLSSVVTVRRLRLTPKVAAVSPQTGSLTGGSRVTIFGEGFEAPTQVFFGDAEAQLIAVGFSQLTVIAPPGRGLGDVPIRIVNIYSNTEVTQPAAYRYVVRPTIAAAGPLEGLFTGGTKITIDGSGFIDAPMFVTVAGVPAAVLEVTPTQIVAVTGAADVHDCADHSGLIEVTNIDNGEVVNGPSFTYHTPQPYFASTPAIVAGKSVDVIVGNVYGPPHFVLDGRVTSPTAVSDLANGTTKYTLPVPASLVFPHGECGDLPLVTQLSYSSTLTGCAITETVVVHPPHPAAECPPSHPRRRAV
jgi:IPT/TIG domain-containing protein